MKLKLFKIKKEEEKPIKLTKVEPEPIPDPFPNPITEPIPEPIPEITEPTPSPTESEKEKRVSLYEELTKEYKVNPTSELNEKLQRLHNAILTNAPVETKTCDCGLSFAFNNEYEKHLIEHKSKEKEKYIAEQKLKQHDVRNDRSLERMKNKKLEENVLANFIKIEEANTKISFDEKILEPLSSTNQAQSITENKTDEYDEYEKHMTLKMPADLSDELKSIWSLMPISLQGKIIKEHNTKTVETETAQPQINTEYIMDFIGANEKDKKRKFSLKKQRDPNESKEKHTSDDWHKLWAQKDKDKEQQQHDELRQQVLKEYTESDLIRKEKKDKKLNFKNIFKLKKNKHVTLKTIEAYCFVCKHAIQSHSHKGKSAGCRECGCLVTISKILDINKITILQHEAEIENKITDKTCTCGHREIVHKQNGFCEEKECYCIEFKEPKEDTVI